MNLKDPESMNAIIGNVLRYGVLTAAAVTLFGTALFAAANGASDSSSFLTYLPDQVPHLQGVDTSLQGFLNGLAGFSPFSWIELGVVLLIATPVSRVLISVLLFAAEGDRLYVVITGVVLTLLLFSMLVTPFIPLFRG